MGMEELKRWMQLYGSVIFVILFNKDWKKLWNKYIISATYQVKWSAIEHV